MVISYQGPSIRQEGPQRCPQRTELRSAGGRERFRARPLPRRNVATKVEQRPGVVSTEGEICGLCGLKMVKTYRNPMKKPTKTKNTSKSNRMWVCYVLF